MDSLVCFPQMSEEKEGKASVKMKLVSGTLQVVVMT